MRISWITSSENGGDYTGDDPYHSTEQLLGDTPSDIAKG
jgi:hypothetical protein